MPVDPADVPIWLLQAVSDQWPDDGDGPLPRVTLMPGEAPTADWCSGDSCWTVYARLDTAFPAAAGVTQDQTPNGFLSPNAQRWHLGTFMCVADMDKDGNPPPAEQQTADTVAILDTMEKLRCAGDRVVRDHFTRSTALLGAWVPSGPSGGCAGGYWPLTLSLRTETGAPKPQSGIARRA